MSPATMSILQRTSRISPVIHSPIYHHPTRPFPPPFPVQKRAISLAKLDATQRNRKRILILGSGWAGYTLARALDPQKYQVVLVSPRSYFVFTPLLASTSTGTLEFRTALEPVRSRRNRAEFFQGWADGVDFRARTLAVEENVKDQMAAMGVSASLPLPPSQGEQRDAAAAAAAAAGVVGSEGGSGGAGGRRMAKGRVFDLRWDELVIAVGCYNQTFGTPGVKEHAYFLKDVGDARRIRKRLLSCFEVAALPTTSDETKRRLLNFAVVGGGPTGIEWSAELHDIIHEDMRKLYPDLAGLAKITVYDVAPKVLSMFDDKLGQYAVDTFKREGIDIKTNHHVEELRTGVPKGAHSSSGSVENIESYTIKIKEEGEIGVGMCVWSTGLMMNPFVADVLAGKVKHDSRSGGILTDDRLRVKREDGSVMDNVYALGDCAVLEGTSYPATAQVASQKAGWLGKRLNKDDFEHHHFTYKDLGVMAYIGNWNAILQSQGGGVSGRAAWIIWRGAYLAKSVSWRNRILIPTYWFLNWLFGRDISRF